MGHRQHPVELVPVAEREFPVPEPPRPDAERELEPKIRRQWEAFWASEIGRIVREVDVPVVERLFLLRNDWERLNRAVSKTPVVPGSQHRPDRGVTHLVPHPFTQRLAKLENSILRLESELGLTPMARQRLGVLATQNSLTLTELNRQLALDDSDDDDPRLLLVEDDAG